MRKIMSIFIITTMILIGCMDLNTSKVEIQKQFNKVDICENNQGEFLGFNDNGSIQILLNEAVSVDFDYLNSLHHVLSELKKGDKVLFTYIKKVEGNITWYGHAVVNIKKVD